MSETYCSIFLILISATTVAAAGNEKWRKVVSAFMGKPTDVAADNEWIANLGTMTPIFKRLQHTCTGSLLHCEHSEGINIVLTSSDCAKGMRGSLNAYAMFNDRKGISIKRALPETFSQTGVLVLVDQIGNRRGLAMPNEADKTTFKEGLLTAGWKLTEEDAYKFDTKRARILPPASCNLPTTSSADQSNPGQLCVKSAGFSCVGGCPLYAHTQDGPTLMGVYNRAVEQSPSLHVYSSVLYHTVNLEPWCKHVVNYAKRVL